MPHRLMGIRSVCADFVKASKTPAMLKARTWLCVGLAPLTFPLGFSNALPSTPELHHKSGLLVLCKRTGYVAHHDPAKGGSFFSAAKCGRPQGARTPPPGPCLSAPRLPGAEVGGLRQRLRTYRMRRSSRPP